jgi:two-component system sensor histidine kinase QseC
MTRQPSLRARLLALLLAAVAVAWIAVVVYSYRDARHEIGEMLDAHLAQSAALLMAQTAHELVAQGDDDRGRHRRRRGGDGHDGDDHHDDDGPEVDIVAPAHRYERRVAFQIWEGDAVLRLRSASAPALRLARRDEGFSDVVLEGRPWRVFSRRDADHGLVVQVGEHRELRDDLAGRIAGHLLAPLLVALPALALLIWLAVGRGLAPLSRVNEQLAQRAPDYLEPLPAGGAPRELRPLIDTLNRLLERVRTALDSERRFTADASHELRTPLAALRTQAQVALAADDAGTRRHALEQMLAGCDRATRLVEQLLTLARLDPEAAARRHGPVALRAVAAQAVADATPRALAKDIDLGLAEGPAIEVLGDPDLLALLLRNLVDNAVRYTQRGGEVSVALERQADGVVLAVSDNGPGIPPGERERVGQRFYRVLGSGESGSGLGLSIVQRICALHGARLVLADGPQGRGLRASVLLPAA